MGYRISDATIFHNAVRNTRLNRFGLSQLQAQLGSGKRLLSVGDDPTSGARVLALRRTDARLDQLDRNIDAARRRLEPTESQLASLSGLLNRLRELAVDVDGVQQLAPDQRDQFRSEIEQRFEELFQISNARFADGYLFSGFRTDQETFTRGGGFVEGVVDAVNPTATYNGDTNILQIQVSETSSVDASVPGAMVFGGDFDGDGATDAGRVNLFDVVRDFRNRLMDPALAGSPLDVIDDLDAGINQVLQVRGSIGARLNRLDTTEAQIRELGVTLETQRSALEDLDLIEASSELASRENTFQASLAVTARVIQPSLLNFLS
jgi:flagellar hook-associated protein 3 FlgL